MFQWPPGGKLLRVVIRFEACFVSHTNISTANLDVIPRGMFTACSPEAHSDGQHHFCSGLAQLRLRPAHPLTVHCKNPRFRAKIADSYN